MGREPNVSGIDAGSVPARAGETMDAWHPKGASWGMHAVPGWRALRTYERDWLRNDIVAGLAITALLVPQGMAYAELAGLPSVTGLYTTVAALFGYAVFGPSRRLLLGPDSALAPLIAATVLPLVGADGDPGRAVALASMLGILVGLVCVAAGALRLGNVAELLSKPVRVGYLDGIAIVVLVSQLPKLFGFSTDADTTLSAFGAFLEGVVDGDTNVTALAIGLSCLGVITALRILVPKAPGILIAVIGATLAVTFFDLASRGVQVVGPAPRGFPRPALPSVEVSDLGPLLVAAVGIAFIALAETVSLSRTLSPTSRDPVRPNGEIVGLGAANIAAGLFQGFPVSASTSRTAVSLSSGGNSQLVGIIGALLIIILLAFANGLLRDLPTAALAAVVIEAAVVLFDFATLRWLWRVRKSEFVLCVTTLVAVVALGVLWGIAVAVALSLGNFIRRAWRPYDAVLGRLGDRHGYHDIERNPRAVEIPGLVIYRFDAPVFFANAEHFARRILVAVDEAERPVSWVLVAAEPITDIDTTGAEVLTDLLDALETRGTSLAFAELKGPVRDRLKSYGLYDRVGDVKFFPTLGTAVDAFLAETGTTWTDPVRGRRASKRSTS